MHLEQTNVKSEFFSSNVKLGKESLPKALVFLALNHHKLAPHGLKQKRIYKRSPSTFPSPAIRVSRVHTSITAKSIFLHFVMCIELFFTAYFSVKSSLKWALACCSEKFESRRNVQSLDSRQEPPVCKTQAFRSPQSSSVYRARLG